jgi:hypothetical protein
VNNTNNLRSPWRSPVALAAVGAVAVLTLGACTDDDDSPDDVDVDPVTSEVTESSMVTDDSEVTIGTTLTSEVEVTETITDVSEVVLTEPGVTSDG